MTPYYQDSAVTLYHGDCREIVPQLGRFDLLLTDPPYGIGSWSATGGNSISKEEAKKINEWDIAPTSDDLKGLIALCRYSIVWGGNYFAGGIGNFRSPLIWDKAIRGMHFADGELAWTNFDFGSLRIFNLSAAASDARGARQHPTQKPTQLMAWCLSLVPDAKTVLDPFAGSGTTGRACKDLGRQCVMIEREEAYCEIAARRCQQEVLNFAQ